MPKGQPRERNFTYSIPQEDLEELEVYAPLSKKHEMVLNDDDADILVTGGAAASGKSYVSLLSILVSSISDKDFVAGVLRKSQRQVRGPGALWEEGNRLFSNFDVTSNQLDLSWRFPSGAFIKAGHLNGNTMDYNGQQVTRYYLDEGQQVAESDVVYLLSRLRSRSELKHQLRITCNPDKRSYLCDWLVKGGYLLENGLPDPDMDGVATWMVQLSGEFHFFSTQEEIEQQYGKDAASAALKFKFYSANVYDNPAIVRDQPGYVFKLEQLPRLEREQLLLGNWFASKDSAGFLDREKHFDEVQLKDVPMGLPRIRAWDTAATVPSETYPNPDYSVGVLCAYDKDTGDFYVLDVERLRDRAAIVENRILSVAQTDGKSTYVSVPQDAGASGKQVSEGRKARLLRQGNRCIISKARGSKLNRAEPFIIAAQEGKVHFVSGSLRKSDFDELEAFDGRKNSGQHDDLIDALADAYTALSSGKVIPTISGMRQDNPRISALRGSTLL